MKKNKKTNNITIFGNGKMALAIAKGLSKNYTLEIVGRDKAKLKEFGKRIEGEHTYLTYDELGSIEGKIVVLCIKPYALPFIKELKLNGKADLLISILAGTKLSSLSEAINATQYIRAMPNVAASHNKSVTSLTGDEKSKEIAQDIFNSIGKSVWLNSEKEIDIATAIAGSGPAYLAVVAEAMSDGAVKLGLSRDSANELIEGLFDGFSALLSESHPALVKESVMSPGGTTAAAVATLEEMNTRSAFIKAVEAAYKRAQELS